MALRPDQDSAQVPIIPLLPSLGLDQATSRQGLAGTPPVHSAGEKSPSRTSTVPDETAGTEMPPPSGAPASHPPRANRFLSPDEWARVAHAIGAVTSGEDHAVVHPKSWLYPPKGMPDGLYRRVVARRAKFRFMYHALSIIHWTLMIMQIVLGAVLTALGSLNLHNGTPITVLAANQTVLAGLLAMMNNSGLPERYRSNEAEFSGVEAHLREMLDSGIVPGDGSLDMVISDCWARFARAQATVRANVPANYISSSALNPTAKAGTVPKTTLVPAPAPLLRGPHTSSQA